MGGFEGGAGSWGEGSGHYDGLGWGSLLYHLDAADVPAAAPTPPAAQSSTSTGSSAVLSASNLLPQTSTNIISSIPTSTSLSVLAQSIESHQNSTATTVVTSRLVLDATHIPAPACEAASVHTVHEYITAYA